MTRKYKENPNDRDNWPNNVSKEIKERTMKFRLKMILIFAVIFLLAMLFGGCITSKGKKLQGVVPTDHGTYRLQGAIDREEREAAEAAAEAAREKALATQIKLPPAKTRPKDTSPSAVGSTHVPPISAVGKPEPFTPTVSEAKLSPSQVLIKMGEEESVSPTEILLEGESSTTGEQGGVTVPEKESPAVKVDWGSLFIYYLLAGLSIVGIYTVYKQWKEHRKTKAHAITKNLNKMRLSQQKRRKNGRRTKKRA